MTSNERTTDCLAISLRTDLSPDLLEAYLGFEQELVDLFKPRMPRLVLQHDGGPLGERSDWSSFLYPRITFRVFANDRWWNVHSSPSYGVAGKATTHMIDHDYTDPSPDRLDLQELVGQAESPGKKRTLGVTGSFTIEGDEVVLIISSTPSDPGRASACA